MTACTPKPPTDSSIHFPKLPNLWGRYLSSYWACDTDSNLQNLWIFNDNGTPLFAICSSKRPWLSSKRRVAAWSLRKTSGGWGRGEDMQFLKVKNWLVESKSTFQRYPEIQLEELGHAYQDSTVDPRQGCFRSPYGTGSTRRNHWPVCLKHGTTAVNGGRQHGFLSSHMNLNCLFLVYTSITSFLIPSTSRYCQLSQRTPSPSKPPPGGWQIGVRHTVLKPEQNTIGRLENCKRWFWTIPFQTCAPSWLLRWRVRAMS